MNEGMKAQEKQKCSTTTAEKDRQIKKARNAKEVKGVQVTVTAAAESTMERRIHPFIQRYISALPSLAVASLSLT
jgi:hypothetical protein